MEPAAHAARRSTARRATARRPGGPGTALRRALRAEVALGVAALAATGALAGYSPGERCRRPARSPPRPTTARRAPSSPSSPRWPARTRSTSTSSTAPTARQWDATKELTVRASLPAQRIAPIALDARKAGPGHYVIGGAPLAPAGDWTLEFVSRVSEFDEHRARFDVPVR